MTCWKVFGESQLTFLLPNLHGLIVRVLHTMGHWEAVAAFVFDFSAQIMLHHLAWLEEMDICLCWNSLHFVYLKWASSEQAFALNQFPGTNRAQLCAPVLPWNAHSWVYGVVYLYRCIFEHLYICVFLYLCICVYLWAQWVSLHGWMGFRETWRALGPFCHRIMLRWDFSEFSECADVQMSATAANKIRFWLIHQLASNLTITIIFHVYSFHIFINIYEQQHFFIKIFLLARQNPELSVAFFPCQLRTHSCLSVRCDMCNIYLCTISIFQTIFCTILFVHVIQFWARFEMYNLYDE